MLVVACEEGSEPEAYSSTDCSEHHHVDARDAMSHGVLAERRHNALAHLRQEHTDVR